MLRRCLSLLCLAALVAGTGAYAQATPEYRAKAGFLYNFIAFTEWPASVGSPLPVCVIGTNPFGDELAALEGKRVGGRSLTVRMVAAPEQLSGCRVVFVTQDAIGRFPRIAEVLRGEPVLTVADSPGALDAGVGVNLLLQQSRIAFEINLAAARRAQLNLSAKLLQLAKAVRQ
ncbi:MAG: YfiR family protein [Gammaproteobacteria bacterium]